MSENATSGDCVTTNLLVYEYYDSSPPVGNKIIVGQFRTLNMKIRMVINVQNNNNNVDIIVIYLLCYASCIISVN